MKDRKVHLLLTLSLSVLSLACTHPRPTSSGASRPLPHLAAPGGACLAQVVQLFLFKEGRYASGCPSMGRRRLLVLERSCSRVLR